MARNAEKAMTALARFRQAQLEEGKVKERRPFLASECTELPKAEKWRRQIIGEISKKVAQIQNAGLGEFRIRDLNDEINKLLREKGHWEVRIKELGGPDYGKVGPKMLDHEGKEVPGNRGYKYFGAAKDLPGVRELFEKEPLPPPRKTRAELMKAIDFEYYGYLDEDDGVIVPLEQEYEKRHRAELVEKWKAEREARLARGEEEEGEEEEEVNIYAVAEEESDEEGGPDRGGEDGQQKFIAHVPVPSQQEVGRWARWALLWVPPVPAGSSDSRGAGDHVQFRVWVQGRRESIHLRAVACPAVHGGSLWLTCAWEEVSGEVDAAPAPPLLPADRGGARAQEEDGAATEVHQRDPAGPERGGPAAPGLLGGPAAASPALLAHTMRPPGWAAGPLASPQPREPTRMCPEWEGQAGPAACKCRQWWGGQPGTPLSAQMCP
uniref:Pre-mRNA-splicing factor ISY1 homolog n=2 Tax=Boreoeutheria TaxID=1437010 RepID=A0A8B9XGU7_BOSMU